LVDKLLLASLCFETFDCDLDLLGGLALSLASQSKIRLWEMQSSRDVARCPKIFAISTASALNAGEY